MDRVSELCSQKIELYAGSLIALMTLVLLKGENFHSPLVLKIGKIYEGGESAGNKRDYARWDELEKISDHLGKRRELNEEEWGDYLAGLIDGDGWIGENNITIEFNELDASLAYEIKKEIGYGRVYKIEGKRAVRYELRKKEGLIKLMGMINGRLRSEKKVSQLKMNSKGWIEVKEKREDNNLRNYWLAGFTEADGSFYINVERSETYREKKSVRLEISIKKIGEEELLKKIKEEFKGGSVSYYKKPEIYCYKSLGMKTVRELIGYFDEYKLKSRKYVSYLKLRKVYRMITRGEHLTERGMEKIESIRSKGSLRD